MSTTASPATPPQPATKPARAKTLYHVLEEVDHDGGKAYSPVGANFRANNAEQAIRDYVATQPDLNDGTVLVAVPAARFNPTKIRISTKTVVKLGDAG